MPLAPPSATRRTYDDHRPTATGRGYDKTWRKLRALVLFEEPLCRECLLRAALAATQPVEALEAVARTWDLRNEWLAATHNSMLKRASRHTTPPQARPSTEVDHILPLAQGGTHDRSNLQGLCHSCHSSKTALESSGWGIKISR